MALYGIMVLSTLMNRNRMSTSIYWQVCSKGTITKPSLMGISMHLHDILVRGQRLIVLFKFLALKMSKVVDGRLWKKKFPYDSNALYSTTSSRDKSSNLRPMIRAGVPLIIAQQSGGVVVNIVFRWNSAPGLEATFFSSVDPQSDNKSFCKSMTRPLPTSVHRRSI